LKTVIHGDQHELKKSRATLQKIANWTCEKLKLYSESLAVIIIDDEALRRMHDQYLGDDTYTDVMTFNLGEGRAVEGEIYISLDRAREQAAAYGVSLPEELARLIIHGILHLAGWDDREPADRRKMKMQEDALVAEARDLFGLGMRD
jgi:rRNA maturation RNase YbeY